MKNSILIPGILLTAASFAGYGWMNSKITMKYLITFFFIPAIVACAVKDTDTPIRTVSMYDSPLIDVDIAVTNPYELALDIRKESKGQYRMLTTMKLFGGSFYVSPLSSDRFSGRFTIEIEDNTNLEMSTDFTETPRSIEEFDPHPFVNGLVNWVQHDTRYDHLLTVRSEEDFDVRGKVIFTIEPKCTLEEIPFIIKFRSGQLTIEKWMC